MHRRRTCPSRRQPGARPPGPGQRPPRGPARGAARAASVERGGARLRRVLARRLASPRRLAAAAGLSRDPLARLFRRPVLHRRGARLYTQPPWGLAAQRVVLHGRECVGGGSCVAPPRGDTHGLDAWEGQRVSKRARGAHRCTGLCGGPGRRCRRWGTASPRGRWWSSRRWAPS